MSLGSRTPSLRAYQPVHLLDKGLLNHNLNDCFYNVFAINQTNKVRNLKTRLFLK